MSSQELENLSYLVKASEGLPALWEDGGGFGENTAEESVRTSIIGDDTSWMFTDADGTESGSADMNSNSAEGNKTDNESSLEERSQVVEDMLSEIYQSPFQQLVYADSLSTSPRQSLSPRKHTTTLPNHRTTSRRESLTQKWEPAVIMEENEETNNYDSIINNNNDDGDSKRRKTEDEVHRETAAGPDSDLQSAIKASIARAALKAVSGYRSCPDADVYVGARSKPTLILARSSQDTTGTPRKSTPNTAVNGGVAVQGHARLADGRSQSLSPSRSRNNVG